METCSRIHYNLRSKQFSLFFSFVNVVGTDTHTHIDHFSRREGIVGVNRLKRQKWNSSVANNAIAYGFAFNFSYSISEFLTCAFVVGDSVTHFSHIHHLTPPLETIGSRPHSNCSCLRFARLFTVAADNGNDTIQNYVAGGWQSSHSLENSSHFRLLFSYVCDVRVLVSIVKYPTHVLVHTCLFTNAEKVSDTFPLFHLTWNHIRDIILVSHCESNCSGTSSTGSD